MTVDGKVAGMKITEEQLRKLKTILNVFGTMEVNFIFQYQQMEKAFLRIKAYMKWSILIIQK